MINVDYVIKNNKNLYIKLNKDGAPVSCPEHEKTLFEQSKAKNVLKGLPKHLRKFNFKIEPVLEITAQINKDVVTSLKKKGY